jgi:aminoglycoside phosphotransferase family enzyme/predicted kinase
MQAHSSPISLPAPTSAFLKGLLDPAAYPHPTGPIKLVETHISWVFLTGDYVYKVKKPVSLGFLDFSTLEARRACCQEELRLNGRFAPELYLASVPITGSAARPQVAGAGEPIEWAVKLRQFNEADQLDRLLEAGKLSAADCEQLAVEIAGVEDRLAVADPQQPWGSPQLFLSTVELNLEQLVSARPETAGRAEQLRGWLAAELAARASLLEDRRYSGKVRECHGDLHLANIVMHEGKPVAFDGIEFNESLRWIDVANDIAFLVMDLHARGRPDLAARVTSGWLEAADDHAAAAVMPLFAVYRAIVRAAVAAIRRKQASEAGNQTVVVKMDAESDRYLDLADHLASSRQPRLFVTSGISGSGKTTVAGQVIERCGAVRVRSDVERKRLAGLRPTERPADDAATAWLYSAAMTQQVYQRLVERAGLLLDAGQSVVVDATCLQRAQRAMFTGLATIKQVPLTWLACELPLAELDRRIAARQAAGDDASDASATVARNQLASFEPIDPAECGEVPGSEIVSLGAEQADFRWLSD